MVVYKKVRMLSNGTSYPLFIDKKKPLLNEVTMIVYKKVRVLSDGNYYPLFIDKKKPFRFGEWMKAEFHPTKGFAPRSLGKDSAGNEIGGWHCCYQPVAPHIADNLKSGERRVWMMCEVKGMVCKYDRPESQGGAWLLAEYLKPIKIIEV